MRRILGWALLLAACGDAGDGINERDECDLDDCVGTYLVTYERLGGNCGTLGQRVINLSGAPDVVGPGCLERAPSRVSDSECKIEQDLVCTDANGGTTESVTAFEQEPGCDEATGIGSIDVASNGSTCSGTYRFTLERQ